MITFICIAAFFSICLFLPLWEFQNPQYGNWTENPMLGHLGMWGSSTIDVAVEYLLYTDGYSFYDWLLIFLVIKNWWFGDFACVFEYFWIPLVMEWWYCWVIVEIIWMGYVMLYNMILRKFIRLYLYDFKRFTVNKSWWIHKNIFNLVILWKLCPKLSWLIMLSLKSSSMKFCIQTGSSQNTWK